MPGNHLMHRHPSVHQRMVSCHDRSCSSRRGVLRVLAAVVVLDAFASRPSQAANDAVLNKLERLKRDEISQEVATPALSRLGRLEGAREQFRKVLRLVQLNQFQSARLQLREGSASTLRKDLRDVEGLYPGVSSELTTGIIDNLQALDTALREKDEFESKERLDAVLNSLNSTVDAIDRAIRA